MKGTIELKKPILFNGKSVKSLAYDTDEISVALWQRADTRRVTANPGQITSVDPMLDYTFQLNIGLAAIIAVNPDYDFDDFDELKGPDIMAVQRVGVNFTRGTSEDVPGESDSGASSESTEEPIMLPEGTPNDQDW